MTIYENRTENHIGCTLSN